MYAGKKIADGHCHLADPRIASEVSELLSRAGEKGIELFVQGGVDPEDWDRQLQLKNEHPGQIVTSFGLHPWWVAAHTAEEFDGAFDLLSERISKADALGEIGLDHGPRVPHDSWENQERAYRGQLGLVSAGKPLVLHVVKAHGPALEGLAGAGGLSGRLSGMVHSFSGSQEIAKKYLDLGLHLSISAVITRKGFETLRRCVSYIPLDRLILESDSPDQKPADWERPWNEPISLFETAKVIGELRGTTAEELLESSTANVKKLFGRSE